MARKKTPARQCPTSIKVDAKKSGLCFRVERVQRNRDKGYITSFFSRSSGRPVGFSVSPDCKRTMDPFQASIRTKEKAERVGQKCAIVGSKKR